MISMKVDDFPNFGFGFRVISKDDFQQGGWFPKLRFQTWTLNVRSLNKIIVRLSFYLEAELQADLPIHLGHQVRSPCLLPFVLSRTKHIDRPEGQKNQAVGGWKYLYQVMKETIPNLIRCHPLSLILHIISHWPMGIMARPT
jgi:hypothetical protein